ncbi:MAG TPA: phage holin family protein [Syntrophobacter fumaroxidans]|nr:phage holin family protein [Syntrophobacter fumaroxidans]
MRGLALRWLVVTFAIVCASYLIEGIRVSGFFSALFAAATLGVLNVFLRPLILILTLPINVLTFGLFTFVINALMLKMASSVIPGFHVEGFWAAVFGALVISVVGWVLSAFIDDRESGGIIDLKKKDGNRWG